MMGTEADLVFLMGIGDPDMVIRFMGLDLGILDMVDLLCMILCMLLMAGTSLHTGKLLLALSRPNQG